MNQRLRRTSLSLCMGLCLLAGLAPLVASGQGDRDATPRLPGGNYTVASRPFMGAGYDSLPVIVTSVTTGVAGGMAIRSFGVENSSARAVDAVRLRWYLSRPQTPETIISQGETPLLRIPGGIDPRTAKRLKYPVASFAAAIRPVLKGQDAGGDYLLQLGVSEVRFVDAPAQTLLTADGRTVRASFERDVARPHHAAQSFCPGQHCTEVLAGGVPVGFKCADSTGESCSNSANGQSCTSGICGRPSGGDDEFAIELGPVN